MIKTTINNREFSVCEDIEELCITNYNKANQFEIIDIGVGSSIASVISHLEKMQMFAFNDKYDELVQQRKNHHQCMWNVARGIDYEYMQLMSFVNGKHFSESENYNLLGIDLDKTNKDATEFMNTKVNKVMSVVDNNIKKKALSDVVENINALKGVIPHIILPIQKETKFDRELIRDLKKKSTNN